MVTNNSSNAANAQYNLLVGTGSTYSNITPGVAGTVLTSNGPSAYPTYQTVSGGGSTTPVGSLQYFSTSGGTSFTDYLACDGSIVSQATYSNLYAKVGLLNGDAQVWTRIDAPTNGSMRTGTVHNNVFYFGGDYGTLISSTNGITWSQNFVPTGDNNASIGTLIYSDKFVCGVSNNGIYTSTDANTWTKQTTRYFQNNCLVYNGSVYAGIYGSPSPTNNLIQTSTDLVTWTNRGGIIYAGTSQSTLIFTGSIFLAAYGYGQYIKSTDGITWYGTLPDQSASCIYGERFVATGSSNSGNYGFFYTSTDFKDWKINLSGTTSSFNALTYGTVYVAGGEAGILYTSTNGETWTSRTSGTTSAIYSLTYGNSLYVYGAGGGVLRTSTDAVTWDARTSGTTSIIWSLAYGNGIYLYGAEGGGLRTSTDAITWDTRTSGVTNRITNITYGNGVYVFGTNSGQISSSTDGITWTARTTNLTLSIYSLKYSNNRFNFISGSVVGTSTDGTTWSYQGIYSSGIPSLIYNGTYYITNSNQKYTSTDGVTWNLLNPVGFPNSIYTCTYVNSKYVFVGNGAYSTSTDLVTFSTYTTTDFTNLGYILNYGTTYFMSPNSGQNSGAMYTSTDLVSWNKTNFPMPGGPQSNNLAYSLYNNGVYVVANTGSPAVNSIYRSINTYSYDSSTQFQLPSDSGAAITYENTANFKRKLYIKYQ